MPLEAWAPAGCAAATASAQPGEVTLAKRDGPAPNDAVGRIGNAHEAVAALVLQQLEEGGKALLADALREGDTLDERRGTPGS